MKLEEMEFGSSHRAPPPGIPGPPIPPGSALRSAFSPRLDLAFRGRSARDQGLIFIMRLLRVREAAWQGRQSLGLAGNPLQAPGPITSSVVGDTGLNSHIAVGIICSKIQLPFSLLLPHTPAPLSLFRPQGRKVGRL